MTALLWLLLKSNNRGRAATAITMIINEKPQQNSNTSVLLSSLTPSSNTGLNSQKVGSDLCVKVDWLQGTFRFTEESTFQEVVRTVVNFLDDKVVWEPGKGRFLGIHWANTAYSVKGMRCYYNLPTKEKPRGHCLLSLPGSALANLSVLAIKQLTSALVRVWKLKVTRFDIALDDYSKSIEYQVMADALEAKQYARFQDFDLIRNGGKSKKKKGFTIYLGSRKSDRKLRFYDKGAESRGQIDSYRLELEAHNEVAQKAVAGWLKIDSNFDELSPKYLASLVVGNVEFVERGKDKNVPRMKRLEWWEALVKRVGSSVRHSIQQVPTNLDKAMGWVHRAVSPTLAVLQEVMGLMEFREYLDVKLANARLKFSEGHLAKIHTWGNQYGFGHRKRPLTVKEYRQEAAESNAQRLQTDFWINLRVNEDRVEFVEGELVQLAYPDPEFFEDGNEVMKVIACSHTHAQVEDGRLFAVWMLKRASMDV